MMTSYEFFLKQLHLRLATLFGGLGFMGELLQVPHYAFAVGFGLEAVIGNQNLSVKCAVTAESP